MFFPGFYWIFYFFIFFQLYIDVLDIVTPLEKVGSEEFLPR